MIDSIANQGPATLDEARHQANVLAKAGSLFARGHRARWLTEDVLEVTGGRAAYRLDLMARTCTCPHFEEFAYCSHLWGYAALLAAQDAGEGGRDVGDG